MHEKHRERLREKALNGIDTFQDHELLELILFSAKPRVNTNDTAHLLLETFGSLSGVFSASAAALAEVKGIGVNTAAFIVTLGAVMKKCSQTLEGEPIKLYSLETIRQTLVDTFNRYNSEVLVIYYLNKNQQIIGKNLIGDHVVDRVNIDMQEFCKKIVYNNPAYVVIAHNHTSGDPRPSKNDVATTEKLCYLLQMNNVKLLDHIIVAGNRVYSFFHENLLQDINERIMRSLRG